MPGPDSPTKLCTTDGCGRPLRARGLCSTHYNQQRPDRHRLVTLQCTCCGDTMLRDPSVRRWATTYCSEICRTWSVHHVGWSVSLPSDHWARHFGETCEWIWPRLPRLIDCRWCGAERSTFRDETIFCSRRCKQRSKQAARHAREHGAPGTYTWTEITRLWIRFDKRCAYCESPTPLDQIQAEHVIAISKGGRNDLVNLLPSCGPCNADKRDLTLTGWAADRERRQLSPRRTAWNPTDPRYEHLVIPTLRLTA